MGSVGSLSGHGSRRLGATRQRNGSPPSAESTGNPPASFPDVVERGTMSCKAPSTPSWVQRDVSLRLRVRLTVGSARQLAERFEPGVEIVLRMIVRALVERQAT